MGQQSVRQAARRGVMEALAARRRERAEQDNRLKDLSVQVAAALMERDEAVAAAERRAGEALRTMARDEGLSMREALAWCGKPVSLREATRLVRAAGTGEASSELPEGPDGAVIEDSAGGHRRDRAGGAAEATAGDDEKAANARLPATTSEGAVTGSG